jgi:putative membrane protein
VAGHEKALALLQGYSVGGDVVPLKEFASATAPVVQQHLDKARSLQK